MKRLVVLGLTAAIITVPIASPIQPAHAASGHTAYKQMLKQGQELSTLTKEYRDALPEGNLRKINTLYDALSISLKRFETNLHDIKGYPARTALHEGYAVPAQIEIERTKYEVSQYRMLTGILSNVSDPEYVESYPYDAQNAVLQRLKERGRLSQENNRYPSVPASITLQLRKLEALAAEKKLFFHTLSTRVEIAEADIEDVDAQYDDFTRYLKHTQLKIGQVPSPAFRTDANKRILADKVLVERFKYEISQLRLFYLVSALIDSGNLDEAKQQFSKLEGLKSRGAAIKQAGGYKPLPDVMVRDLEQYEQKLNEKLK